MSESDLSSNDAKDTDELIEEWKKSSGLEFHRIHQEIKRRNDPNAVEPLIEMLDNLVYNYDDNADYIIDILCGLRDPRAIIPIIHALHRVDFMSAAGLAVFAKQAIVPLIGALKSPEWLTRQNAAYLLGCKPFLDTRSVQSLLDVALNKHENVVLRCQAIFSIGKIGDVNSIEALSNLLSDDVSMVRIDAAKAIQEIKQNQDTQ